MSRDGKSAKFRNTQRAAMFEPSEQCRCTNADGTPKRTHTAESAKRAIAYKKGLGQLGGEMHKYRCPTSRWFHLGHKVPRRVRYGWDQQQAS